MRWALGLAMALWLGCTTKDGPVDPVWGKEPCRHCAMLVGDRRHAAQAVVDGDRHFFDDLGCLAAWLGERAGKGARAWVRDEAGAAWIDADKARYGTGARTPMDYGFEARAGGDLDWDGVRARVAARARKEGTP